MPPTALAALVAAAGPATVALLLQLRGQCMWASCSLDKGAPWGIAALAVRRCDERSQGISTRARKVSGLSESPLAKLQGGIHWDIFEGLHGGPEACPKCEPSTGLHNPHSARGTRH